MPPAPDVGEGCGGFCNSDFISSSMAGSRVYACLGLTRHLHFLQNHRGLLRATAVTRGWNGHRISTQSYLWRRKFYRRSCRYSNSQPFDHEFGALPTRYPGSHDTHTFIHIYINTYINTYIIAHTHTGIHTYIHLLSKLHPYMRSHLIVYM